MQACGPVRRASSDGNPLLVLLVLPCRMWRRVQGMHRQSGCRLKQAAFSTSHCECVRPGHACSPVPPLAFPAPPAVAASLCTTGAEPPAAGARAPGLEAPPDPDMEPSRGAPASARVSMSGGGDVPPAAPRAPAGGAKPAPVTGPAWPRREKQLSALPLSPDIGPRCDGGGVRAHTRKLCRSWARATGRAQA